MQGLKELQERRAYECRLTPDRALATIDEAEQFLRDRGLLTRTADSALPSLFEACHEEPYSSTSPGFGQWPATKWPWFGEVAGRGYLVLSVHRGKNLLVADEIAAVLDPICRTEIERMHEADPNWARLLDHLAEAGPSNIEDLQVELELKPKELKSLRAPLERCGAIVSHSREVSAGHGHTHTSELARWDQVHPGAGAVDVRPHHSLGNLLVAAVRAAVVAPERELKRWFSWPWYWDDSIVDELVRERDGSSASTATSPQRERLPDKPRQHLCVDPAEAARCLLDVRSPLTPSQPPIPSRNPRQEPLCAGSRFPHRNPHVAQKTVYVLSHFPQTATDITYGGALEPTESCRSRPRGTRPARPKVVRRRV